MEVYLKKKDLPKNCFNCPCFNHEFMNCDLDDEEKGFFLDEIDGGECPLKTIEEVYNEKIITSLKKTRDWLIAHNLKDDDCYKEVEEILNLIGRGEE